MFDNVLGLVVMFDVGVVQNGSVTKQGEIAPGRERERTTPVRLFPAVYLSKTSAEQPKKLVAMTAAALVDHVPQRFFGTCFTARPFSFLCVFRGISALG